MSLKKRYYEKRISTTEGVTKKQSQVHLLRFVKQQASLINR
jgi:hypothetical protein